MFMSLCSHCIKQIDSMLLWVSSVTEHRRRKNVVQNVSDTRAALPCFYHIYKSSVIYFLTDARQHEIYLLN